jgi:hypothetical protein
MSPVDDTSVTRFRPVAESTVMLLSPRQEAADSNSVIVVNTTSTGAPITTDREATCATGNRLPSHATAPIITAIAMAMAKKTLGIISLL